jgi:predicted TIM-barrel fold metal-dependent hydrolase
MAREFRAGGDVASIREGLDHPVIDADGHLMEIRPVVAEYLADVAGRSVAERWLEGEEGSARRGRHRSSPFEEEARQARLFWPSPAENSLDRMTSFLPRLQYERAEQLGLDYMLLYPSLGLRAMREPDDDLRRALTRALNTYYADLYRDFRDRLEPVAVIPLVDPVEAVAELEYAVEVLGFKAIASSGVIERATGPNGSRWLDTVGFGSPHDYDPFWARCVQLGVAPTFHGVGFGWGTRTSPKNYVYNHLGNFAASQEATCRSLVMGGVPFRFPELRFSFLEGGVGWASQLYSDLLGHFEKRNKDVVQRFDPRRIDVDACRDLFDEFATGRIRDLRTAWERNLRSAKADAPELSEAEYDDFAISGITDPDQIVELFDHRFYFGCEADDPINALAFDSTLLPHSVRLGAMFASDVGHWDVPDMTEVLPEAWELVEDGHLTKADFADFTCGNVVALLTAQNPGFFEGTAVADAVAPFLGR